VYRGNISTIKSMINYAYCVMLEKVALLGIAAGDAIHVLLAVTAMKTGYAKNVRQDTAQTVHRANHCLTVSSVLRVNMKAIAYAWIVELARLLLNQDRPDAPVANEVNIRNHWAKILASSVAIEKPPFTLVPYPKTNVRNVLSDIISLLISIVRNAHLRTMRAH